MVSKSRSRNDFEAVGYSTDGHDRYPIVKENTNPEVFYSRGTRYSSLDLLISEESSSYDIVLYDQLLDFDFKKLPVVFEGEFNSGRTIIGCIWSARTDKQYIVRDHEKGLLGIMPIDESSYTAMGDISKVLNLINHEHSLSFKYDRLEAEEIALIREYKMKEK